MTTSDFESAYFEFDILFQEILEELQIMDTYSMDAVTADFKKRVVIFDWRYLNDVVEISEDYIYKYLNVFRRVKEELGTFKESQSSNNTNKKEAIHWLQESLSEV